MLLLLIRDMDEARSILKECGEFIGQATSTVPRSVKIAQSGRVGGAANGTEPSSNDKEESMEVSDGSGPKVRLMKSRVVFATHEKWMYDGISYC